MLPSPLERNLEQAGRLLHGAWQLIVACDLPCWPTVRLTCASPLLLPLLLLLPHLLHSTLSYWLKHALCCVWSLRLGTLKSRNTRNLFFWQLRPSSDYCIALNADMLTDITFFCLLKTFWTTKYKCCLTAFSIYLHNCSVGFIMLNGICEFSFPLMPNYVHMLLMLCKVRKRPIKDNYHKPNYKTKQHSFIHYLNKHIALRSSFIAIIVLLLLQSITTHMLWKLFLETTRASSS